MNGCSPRSGGPNQMLRLMILRPESWRGMRGHSLYEQVLQERGVPDPHRGGARVLRAEADRQLEQVSRRRPSATSSTSSTTAGPEHVAAREGQHRQRHDDERREVHRRLPRRLRVAQIITAADKNLPGGGSDFDIQGKTSNGWLSLLTYILPFVIFIGFWIFLMNQVQGGGSKVMSFGKSRAKRMSVDSPKITFRDVAGVDEAVEELHEIKEFLENPKKFQALGARIPKGVLLYGPPGTGKTLLARAVAGEAGRPVLQHQRIRLRRDVRRRGRLARA